ncbi:MAG: hypothetical protein QXX85_02050 [Candidatus Nitrosotenuis sp.]
MAKRTAEKYLKQLVQENQVIKHKHGIIVQYYLSESNSTVEQLHEQYDVLFNQLTQKIDEIRNNYKKYSPSTKRSFIYYLEEMLDSLSRNLSDALNDADIQRKYLDLSYYRELVDDIKKMNKEMWHPTYKKLGKVEKLGDELIEYWKSLNTVRISHKRKHIQEKMAKINKEITDLTMEIETVHASLKSKNST